MKKVIFPIITALIAVLLGFSAFADTPPAYDKVNAIINVGKDGRLSVTEEWDITFFTSDSEKTFTRYIDMPESSDLKSVEKYASIDNITVISDGQAINDFDIKKGEKDCAITINKATEEKSVHYVITYDISGAVKKDGGKARICFRIFGSQTGTLNNVSISVTGDSITKNDTAILSLADLSPELSDGKITFTAPVIRDTMTVDLNVPSDSFDKGALASYSKTADSFKAFSSKAKTTVPALIVVIAMVVIAVLKLMGTSAIRKKIESAPDDYNAQSVFPETVTMPEAAKMLTYCSPVSSKKLTRRAAGIFALGIAQLIKDGFICTKDGKTVIDTSKIKDMPTHQKMLAEMFVKYAVNVDETLTLNKDALDAILKDADIYKDYLYNLTANYIKLMPEYNGKFFKSEENRKIYASLCKINAGTGKTADLSSSIVILMNTPDTDESQILPIGLCEFTAENSETHTESYNSASQFAAFVCAITAKISGIFSK